MASTTIAVSTSLDVIDRYRELVEASLDGDSIYIRAKETVERLYENSEMSGAKKAEIVASTVTSMAASISANCMQLALQWESQESELGLKKEELEYRIDLMKLEADKAKFQTLARAIVGQQISVKAAQSVWDRTTALTKKFTAKAVLKLEPTQLREAGLSQRKVEYMQDLANHFENGGLHCANWDQLDDETVIAELTAIRGIGRWTAEMFLIFYLMRPNVLPLDDIGLIKGISLAYFSGEPVSRHEAREVAANWEPWKTVATWYMWRSIDPIPVEY